MLLDLDVRKKKHRCCDKQTKRKTLSGWLEKYGHRKNKQCELNNPKHIALLDRSMDHLHLDEFITINFWTVLKTTSKRYLCVGLSFGVTEWSLCSVWVILEGLFILDISLICEVFLPHIFMVLVFKLAEWLSQALDGRPKLSVVVIEKPWVVFCQMVT